MVAGSIPRSEMMGFFGAIGKAFKKVGKGVGKGAKKVGKGAWWAVKRPEAQILVSAFWPASVLMKTISLVKLAEGKGFETGTAKKAWVMSLILEVALKAGINRPSDLENLIEDALAVVERRAQMKT